MMLAVSLPVLAADVEILKILFVSILLFGTDMLPVSVVMQFLSVHTSEDQTGLAEPVLLRTEDTCISVKRRIKSKSLTVEAIPEACIP